MKNLHLIIIIISSIILCSGCAFRDKTESTIDLKNEIKLGCYGVCVLKHKIRYEADKKIIKKQIIK